MASVNGTKIPQATEIYGNTYNSIGGVNIKAVFFGITFGNLQAISFSITREKAPIYTMGSPNVRGFARGKRAIAGSLVMIMFDNHALLNAIDYAYEAHSAAPGDQVRFTFVTDNDEVRPPTPEYTAKMLNHNAGNLEVNNTNSPARLVNPYTSLPFGSTQYYKNNILNAEQSLGSTIEENWSRTKPWYSDQIPAFNIVLTGVNEDGAAATMSILGVEILNEGFGISIDDIIAEQQMTYVARAISRWTRLNNNLGGFQGVGSLATIGDSRNLI